MAMQPGLNESSKRDDLLRQAAALARKYARGIGERRVAPAEKDVDNLKQFHEPLPNAPIDAMEILQRLDDIGSPAQSRQPAVDTLVLSLVEPCPFRSRQLGWRERGIKTQRCVLCRQWRQS